MNKVYSFILVLLLLIYCVTGDIWSSCGKSSDHFQITSVTITPDPPVKGQSLSISASGNLDEEVTAGNVHIIIKYGFITVLNENQDICQPSDPVFTCPIQSGFISKNFTVQVPSSVPSGKYDGNFVVTDQNNQEIACINVDLSF